MRALETRIEAHGVVVAPCVLEVRCDDSFDGFEVHALGVRGVLGLCGDEREGRGVEGGVCL